MKIRSKLALAVTAAACTALPITVTHAQDDGADNSLALEEITVSARRRTESLQEVPVAVAVIGEQQIDQLSITSVESVAKFTSGLTYDQGILPVDTRPVIRGVTSHRGRPNVGVLVDFVDVSSEALTVAGGGITTNLRLLDLERIEVVKGPQSALYGRSAFTGALNYITKRPSESFTSEIRLDYNDATASDVRLSIGGPLSDSFRANAIFSKYDSDGYYTNPNTGGELGASDTMGGALGLEWDLSERTSMYFRVEHSSEEHTPRAEVHVSAMDPASLPANFIGTGTVTDDAIGVPHSNFDTAVCNATDRIQPYYDSFGIPGAQPCIPLIAGEMHATGDMIDLSPDPRTGRDFLGSDIETTRYHFDFNVDFEGADFSYIFGYLDNSTHIQEDFDKNNRNIYSSFAPFPPPGSTTSQYGLSAMAEQHLETTQMSNELRLSGEGERMAWTLSLLHWEEDMQLLHDDEWYLREGGNAGAVLDVLNATVFNYLQQPIAPPFINNMCDLIYPGDPACIPMVTSLSDSLMDTPAIPINRNTKHTSFAASAIVDVTDTFSVTLEGRVLTEVIDYEGEATDISFSSQFGNDPWWGFMFRDGPMTYNTVEDNAFTPKVTLDWAMSDNALGYASFATAFKPGGVSTTDANGDVRDGEYKPEQLEVYELGLKTDFRNRSIRWNSAVFYYDYTDQQVPYQFISPTTGLFQTTIINAGKTEIKGFETDVVWNSAFVDGLSMSLGYTYTDAEYTDFNLAEILGTVGGTVSAFNRAKAGNEEGDLTGKTPALTAENAATGTIRYDAMFSGGTAAYIELFASYQSERFLGEGNRAWIPAYTLMDLYTGISRDSWSFTLYVQNLADDDKIKSGVGNVDFTLLPDGRSLPQAMQLYLPQPRTIGGRIQLNFGD